MKSAVSEKHPQYSMPLECVTVGKDNHISPLGILLHGFGATAESMREVAQYFLPTVPYWIVPQAPVDLFAFVGDRAYAWFPSQSERIMEAATGSLWNRLEDENFEELECIAKKIIEEYIIPMKQKAHSRPIVLMGYSQGGMVASEVVLQCLAYNIVIDAVVLFSTCMVARQRWQDLAQKYLEEKPRSVKLPEIFQSHGTMDTVLTLDHAHRMKEFWDSYTKVQFIQFDGGHELPLEVLEHTKHYLDGIF